MPRSNRVVSDRLGTFNTISHERMDVILATFGQSSALRVLNAYRFQLRANGLGIAIDVRNMCAQRATVMAATVAAADVMRTGSAASVQSYIAANVVAIEMTVTRELAVVQMPERMVRPRVGMLRMIRMPLAQMMHVVDAMTVEVSRAYFMMPPMNCQALLLRVYSSPFW